jgi:hypothetical protein
MRATKLLRFLPDFNMFSYTRLVDRMIKSPVRSALDEILQRVMGDVVDWLRLTPNAV